MKSCRRCKNYIESSSYCKIHNIKITDIFNATYCSSYNAKVKDKVNVKCVNCKNINKYNYCSIKKRCFNFEERIKERKCINFRSKKINK